MKEADGDRSCLEKHLAASSSTSSCSSSPFVFLLCLPIVCVRKGKCGKQQTETEVEIEIFGFSTCFTRINLSIANGTCELSLSTFKTCDDCVICVCVENCRQTIENSWKFLHQKPENWNMKVFLIAACAQFVFLFLFLVSLPVEEVLRARLFNAHFH